jgi:hypothetical protein
LEAIKTLLFEPCIEEDCNCSRYSPDTKQDNANEITLGKNIPSGGDIPNGESPVRTNELADIRKAMNLGTAVPVEDGQSHSQDDSLQKLFYPSHDADEWPEDLFVPTRDCGSDNTSQGIQPEDRVLANRGPVAEEAQTIDPRLTVSEWSDCQHPWVRHIGMDGPSDHVTVKIHRQFTSSLSDTISSLASLSLDMPPEKR